MTTDPEFLKQLRDAASALRITGQQTAACYIEEAVAEIERLSPKPTGRTVKVRIACRIAANGEWTAYGYSHETGDDVPDETLAECADGMINSDDSCLVWLTAYIPLPETAEIQAE